MYTQPTFQAAPPQGGVDFGQGNGWSDPSAVPVPVDRTQTLSDLATLLGLLGALLYFFGRGSR